MKEVIIYIVIGSTSYEQSHVLGVFSSADLAEKFINSRPDWNYEDVDFEEHILDLP